MEILFLMQYHHVIIYKKLNLNQNYYLGFYTAAKIYGASHQQVQRDYVLTTTPKLNNISKGTLDIRFFTTSHWPDNNILTKKADAGIQIQTEAP